MIEQDVKSKYKNGKTGNSADKCWSLEIIMLINVNAANQE